MLVSDNKTRTHLPTAEELLHKDNKPVDSQLHRFISELLHLILEWIWERRQDWFFGVDIGLYYDPDKNAIAPDGFLCLGVPRYREGGETRLSYITWDENEVAPILALEVVSKTPGGEFKRKKRIYAKVGVLYYVIYAPWRRRQRRLMIYRLNGNGEYELIDRNPVWMPEIGLGIGTEVGTHYSLTREWLYWYDEVGIRYSTPQEDCALRDRQAKQEAKARLKAQKQAKQAQKRAEKMAAKLRELGIDPEEFN